MSPSTVSTPTRIASANAFAFLIAWTAFCCVKRSLQPDDWDRLAADERFLGTLLVIALGGMTIVFWRVRSAYNAGEVRIYRAVTEGSASAVAYYLIVFAALMSLAILSNGVTWEEIWRDWEFGGKELLALFKVAVFGVVFATSLWLANRYVLKRTRSREIGVLGS